MTRQRAPHPLFCAGWLLAAGLAVFGATPPARADDCASLQERAAVAQKAGDTAALKSVFEAVAVEPSCADAYRGQLGRAVVRSVEKQVYQAVSAGQPLAPFAADLSDALRFGPSWRAQAWLGDIARDTRDYTTAARRYQEALTVLGDEVATPQAPDTEVIARIFRQAEEMRLLSASYVTTPVTRAGTPGGLGAAGLRGFVPTKVAYPIEFAYDSAAFTAKGEAAAADLAAILRSQAPESITLAGHTDARGSLAYNMDLSLRRAEAVAAYLRANGYDGGIRLEGYGPKLPLTPDDPGRYTDEERHQLNRRVELRR